MTQTSGHAVRLSGAKTPPQDSWPPNKNCRFLSFPFFQSQLCHIVQSNPSITRAKPPIFYKCLFSFSLRKLAHENMDHLTMELMIKWIFSHLDLRPPPQLNLYIAGRKRICYLSLIMPCDQLQPSGDHICHLIKKRLRYSVRFLSLGKKIVPRKEFYLRKVRTHFVFLRKSPSSKMIFLTRDFLEMPFLHLPY